MFAVLENFLPPFATHFPRPATHTTVPIKKQLYFSDTGEQESSVSPRGQSTHDQKTNKTFVVEAPVRAPARHPIKRPFMQLSG